MRSLNMDDLIYNVKLSEIYVYLCIIVLPVVAYFFTNFTSLIQWIRMFIVITGGCIATKILCMLIMLTLNLCIDIWKASNRMYRYYLIVNVAANITIGTAIICKVYQYLKLIK